MILYMVKSKSLNKKLAHSLKFHFGSFDILPYSLLNPWYYDDFRRHKTQSLNGGGSGS